jgi:CRISPR-associated endoribonuclease Cas6
LARIQLRLLSPTAFRTRTDYGTVPPPRLCMEGWLRKWNEFSPVLMPDGILEYAEACIRVEESDLRPVRMQFGRVRVNGVQGVMRWHAGEEQPYILRLVNALADFASYCGTGVMTTRGMGQTKRLPSR